MTVMDKRSSKGAVGKKLKRGALSRGNWAEVLAAMVLRVKGYRILARNFRCRSGEIDIIAKKRDLIVFVEVKYRPSLESAITAVSHENQRRVANAADFWQSRQSFIYDCSLRFDIFAISGPFKFLHLEDAF